MPRSFSEKAVTNRPCRSFQPTKLHQCRPMKVGRIIFANQLPSFHLLFRSLEFNLIYVATITWPHLCKTLAKCTTVSVARQRFFGPDINLIRRYSRLIHLRYESWRGGQVVSELCLMSHHVKGSHKKLARGSLELLCIEPSHTMRVIWTLRKGKTTTVSGRTLTRTCWYWFDQQQYHQQRLCCPSYATNDLT